MDARLRSSLYEGAHGSPLYAAPRKNINPSTSGDRIQEEIAEVTKWVNQHLGSAGHTEQLVTDLGVDMADGITLLQVVQSLAKEDLPKHFPNPIMRVQKLENLQVCLHFLEQKGLSVKGIHANDIAGGNMKSILAICHALRRFFTASKSPTANRSGSSVSVSPPAPTVSLSPSSTSPEPGGGGGGGQFTFSSLDREDVALLGWLGEVVHRVIPSYSVLYDGKVFCDFANEVKSGAVSELDIISGSAPERLLIAFSALETSLFVRPQNLNIAQISSGREDAKLRHFLASCRSVYQQMVEMKRKTRGGRMKGGTERKSGGERRLGAPLPTKMSRELVFESLRNSSRSQTPTTGSLEQRERAKVEARSLDGIRQQKRNGHSSTAAVAGERVYSQGVPKETQSGVNSKRLSSSIDSLPSATKLSTSTSSSVSKSKRNGREPLHRSHDFLSRPTQGNLRQQNRPFSEIYVAGDPTFPFSSPGGGVGEKRLNELPLSPEDWELDGREGRALHDSALSLSQPDHPVSYKHCSPSPALSQTQPPPSSLSHSLSRSMDRGLSQPPASRQLSTPSPSSPGDHTPSLNSGERGSGPTFKSPGSSSTLPRTKKHSLPLSSPSPPPPPSVPPPSSVSSVNQPTFVPLGGGMVGRRKLPPAYPLSGADSVEAEINDLHDRIMLLSNQLLYEKADVYTRLHRAVIRERRRRQAVEKRLRDFEALARRLARHYDNLFVQLGKEVASLREESVGRGDGSEARRGREEGNRSGTGSGNRLYLTREIDQLKEQVAKLMKHQDLHTSKSSLASSAQPHPEHLFLRKRANSEASLHGPFMKGSLSSFKKVSRFFGEEPPRVETIETFLDGLGYSHLLPTFTAHQISLAELHQMDTSHLEVLGVPLGPRVRIMSELTKLEPLDLQKDSL